jgi:hypothetical protein
LDRTICSALAASTGLKEGKAEDTTSGEKLTSGAKLGTGQREQRTSASSHEENGSKSIWD